MTDYMINENMSERIKEIRKENGLTQTEFAEKLKISKNMIAQVETSKAHFSDRTIAYVCELFHIDENWLRLGVGKKYKNLSENQKIAMFMNDIMESPSDDARKKVILALADLDLSEWLLLSEVCDKVAKYQ